MPNKPLVCAALFQAALFGAAPALVAQPADCAPDRVVIVTDDGPVTLSVEIADDPQERARGLMFRRELLQGRGMFFVYDRPQPLAFWMKNTLIPLDILFLDASGRIRHIQPLARPLDETPLPGAAMGDAQPDRQFVLEIGGGEAARLGLSVGQALAWPGIDPTLAAAPCR